jgi:hypothetical protein
VRKEGTEGSPATLYTRPAGPTASPLTRPSGQLFALINQQKKPPNLSLTANLVNWAKTLAVAVTVGYEV